MMNYNSSTSTNGKVVLIAAMEYGTRLMGRSDGTLPWKIPEDLQYFKMMTTGSPVIMGRKTFNGLDKPLDNRTNVVLTRTCELKHVPNIVCPNLEEAVKWCKALFPCVFIIGGLSVFTESLEKNLVDECLFTLIEFKDQLKPVGDLCFPAVTDPVWYQVDFKYKIHDKYNLTFIKKVHERCIHGYLPANNS